MDCLHEIEKSGFCIKCGIGKEQQDFHTNDFKPLSKAPIHKNKHYTYTDKTDTLTKSIKSILSDFDLGRFNDEVIETIKNKNFKMKMNLKQKVAVTVFYLSRKNKIYVEIDILVKMIDKNYKKLLKFNFVEFGFVKNDGEQFLYEYYILFKSNGFLCSYYKCLEKLECNRSNHPSVSIQLLALSAVFFQFNKQSVFSKLDLQRYVDLKKINFYNSNKIRNRKNKKYSDKLTLKNLYNDIRRLNE